MQKRTKRNTEAFSGIQASSFVGEIGYFGEYEPPLPKGGDTLLVFGYRGAAEGLKS